MPTIDETHDASVRSWVSSANDPTTDFPIQNLPFGVFRTSASDRPRVGVAIGSAILDLGSLVEADVLDDLRPFRAALTKTRLNGLMALGNEAARRIRRILFAGLRAGSPLEATLRGFLVPADRATMEHPADIGDFTDFYTSYAHADRAGRMARPDNPVHPNFTSMPIAYHGRASSVVVSGTPCVRPLGQTSRSEGTLVPTDALDFEMEVGCFIGPGNALGSPVGIDGAEAQVFGLCLVNDWSARDIQRWESLPLGPFLAKSFMTTISPWVVTLDALAPFRVPAPARATPGYLTSPAHAEEGHIDIALAATVQTSAMRELGLPPEVIARPAFRDQHWTLFQMLAHHTSNGCNLRPGDLLSSGTVSGPDRADSGCLLERTVGGAEPLTLRSGETRGYLTDGDRVAFRAACARPGFATIGFGPCEGTVVPARAS